MICERKASQAEIGRDCDRREIRRSTASLRPATSLVIVFVTGICAAACRLGGARDGVWLALNRSILAHSARFRQKAGFIGVGKRFI